MREFARRAEISQRRVLTLVDETVERIHEAWPLVRDELCDERTKIAVEATFASVPLVRDDGKNS